MRCAAVDGPELQAFLAAFATACQRRHVPIHIPLYKEVAAHMEEPKPLDKVGDYQVFTGGE